MASAARLLIVGVMALVATSCGDGGDSSAGPESTTSSSPTVSTGPTTAVTSLSSSTTSPPPYGSPCEKGSHPDCIDPDGRGEHVYLKGGAECIRALGQDSGLCSDLDGDGVAGYPDSG